MSDNANFNWNASDFFHSLAQRNKLAIGKKFRFCRVSGLAGFEEALASMQSTTAFVCVQDEDDGYITLENTPHTRRVKTVFFAMRHPVSRMDLRNECFVAMRELFRQFMSALLPEKTRLAERHIYLDPRITFHEMEQYFASGCACAYFQIAVDVYTDLRFNETEWQDNVFDDTFNEVYG